MPVSNMNGATIGISATLPATYNASGYAAVTFTNIGEVVDIGGELGKVFNEIAHQTLQRAYPQKLKGSYNISNMTITIGKIVTDGGQVLLQTALNSSASFSFIITLPSGNTGSLTGKVMKAAQGAIAVDSVETTVVDIAIDPQSLFEA